MDVTMKFGSGGCGKMSTAWTLTTRTGAGTRQVPTGGYGHPTGDSVALAAAAAEPNNINKTNGLAA
jgi:hypothetical protein